VENSGRRRRAVYLAVGVATLTALWMPASASADHREDHGDVTSPATLYPIGQPPGPAIGPAAGPALGSPPGAEAIVEGQRATQPAAAAAPAQAEKGDLAFTGMTAVLLVIEALGLGALGWILIVAGRRRATKA
jgi:hypothetical protein